MTSRIYFCFADKTATRVQNNDDSRTYKYIVLYADIYDISCVSELPYSSQRRIGSAVCKPCSAESILGYGRFVTVRHSIGDEVFKEDVHA